MRKLIIVAATVITFVGCTEEKKGSFELKGTLSDAKGEMIYLEKLTTPQPVLVDSTMLDENGNFEFKNYSPKIGFYRIKTSPQNFAMLVLDSADKVTVTGSIKDLGNTYKATGSPETSLFMQYSELQKQNKIQMDSLNQAFQGIMQSIKMDSLRMDSLSKVFQGPYESIMARYNKIVAEKIKANTSMYASIMAIQGMEPDQYGDLYIALDKGLTAKYPNDKTVRTFHEVINKMLATINGQGAPEINLPTPDGKELALSSFKGKIVLVDFWA
ncbi:MAG: DUF4369 domain-containing protein, partial [Bacteroidetes bacterium]|nr:DUF4369 domain-containing protein [Bacteroidota bacterium]